MILINRDLDSKFISLVTATSLQPKISFCLKKNTAKYLLTIPSLAFLMLSMPAWMINTAHLLANNEGYKSGLVKLRCHQFQKGKESPSNLLSREEIRKAEFPANVVLSHCPCFKSCIAIISELCFITKSNLVNSTESRETEKSQLCISQYPWIA